MNAILTKRIKRNGRILGWLAASGPDEGNYVRIGWSKLNNLDRENSELGKTIAIRRSEIGTNKLAPIGFREEINQFAKRCLKYFKGKKIHSVVFGMNSSINNPEKIVSSMDYNN